MSTAKEVKSYKLACEANIVACLFKEPDLFYSYDNLKLEDFTFNEWKVFYTIGKEVIKEGKPVLDDITLGFYLEKHPKLKAKYDEYGGYSTLDTAKAYVNIENLDGYVQELHKWNVILKLIQHKFPIDDRLKDFKDMTTEEVYDWYEATLNDIFINVETSVKSYNLCEDIHTLIDECDKGVDMGFPITSQLLNDEIGGNMLGNVTLFGGISGTGKTTLTLEFILPNIIKHDEKCVMVINEQDQKKTRKEMLVWVANNIFDHDFNKKRLRQGKFVAEELTVLRKAADWLEEKKNNKNITVIPLQTYTVDIMKKIINKYCAMGVKYFILDTFKINDTLSATDQVWLDMMISMRKLYDCVKPANKNVHLWCTLQLEKNNSMTSRYLTTRNIGMSKNVVDPCSTVLLMRGIREDEKEGGKNELKVYRLEGKNGRTKIPVKIHKDKNYCIIFIDKNREGSTREYQIVAESNLGLNTYKEIGITNVPEDF